MGEETVNVVDGQAECFSVKLVLLRDLHEPVDQDASHAGGDIGLLLHVLGFGAVADLQNNVNVENRTHKE